MSADTPEKKINYQKAAEKKYDDLFSLQLILKLNCNNRISMHFAHDMVNLERHENVFICKLATAWWK